MTQHFHILHPKANNDNRIPYTIERTTFGELFITFGCAMLVVFIAFKGVESILHMLVERMPL